MTDMIARAEDRPHEEIRRTESAMGEWAWSIRYEKGLTLKEIGGARGRHPFGLSDLQWAILEVEADGWRQEAMVEQGGMTK